MNDKQLKKIKKISKKSGKSFHELIEEAGVFVNDLKELSDIDARKVLKHFSYYLIVSKK